MSWLRTPSRISSRCCSAICTREADHEPMEEHAFTYGLTFDESDMQSLREGTLTQAQCQKLQELQSRSNRLKLGCAVPMVLAMGCLTCFMCSLMASRPLPPFGNVIVGIGVLLAAALVVAVVAVVAMQLVRFNRDIAARRVESLTGPTRIITTGTSGSRSNYIEVNGTKFPTTMWFYQLENPGAVYRVYFLPRSRVLITAEQVGN